ncbi:hypothetical protein [Sphingomonas psychrotolerans]|uniref:hypothetical protein n=1 Tax=Sphingomonas psychrotolerans TaxID=1327635 RepID=UPI0013052BDC|nr:hypothetical protein [Sphingomonas psychrotolerans]
MLDGFLADAADWSLAERVAFAKWVMRASGHEQRSPRVPAPLIRRLLAPAAAEQAHNEPGDAEAQLLLAVLGDPSGAQPVDRYRAAVALAPANAMIGRVFVRAVLDWTDYAQHELPCGYLGDPEEDAGLLEQAIASANAFGLGVPTADLLAHRLALARAAIAGRIPGGE